MKRRFIIGVQDLTRDEEFELRKYLSSLGKWWHWIANLWLFVTANEEVDVENIIRMIDDIHPGSRKIVMEFPEDKTWIASEAVNSKGKNMTLWLRTVWGPGDHDG